MFATLLLSLLPVVSGLSCLNEKGAAVDLWAAIKQPTGTGYLYYEPGQSLSVSPYSMNDTDNGALAWTTQQLWSSEADTYVIFNDEPPESSYYNFSYGHTKGYFAVADDLTGFYITHSIPMFPKGPSQSKSYTGLGGNAYTYAQNVLCLSVNASTLDALSYKFQLNRPQIYDSKVSNNIEIHYKNISNLANGKYATAAICADQDLATVGGVGFTIFAKSTQWGKDLYDSCVAERLSSDLWVESWIRGSAEGPDCPASGFQTLDVESVDFGSGYSWSETQDHSKWAVAINQSIVCMGDINRMTTQYTRGGGTACLIDSALYEALEKASTKTDSCVTVTGIV
jgi:deoxyribonuclease-2